MLQNLISVELRQVAAETHQNLIQGQQFLEVAALLVFHDVFEDGRQPEQTETVQLADAGLQGRGRATEELYALLGTQRVVFEELMTLSQLLFYYSQALPQFCIKPRVLFFQIQEYLWPIIFPIQLDEATNKRVQALELFNDDFFIGIKVGLFAEDGSCFDDLNDEIYPVGDPQGLFDGLLVEPWNFVLLEIFKEVLDGFAEGILVDLAKKWSLGIRFDVSQVLFGVLLVYFGDVLNGFWGISGSFGDFGVSDDIGFNEQNGQILLEFFIVLGSV